jgi:hypothetical protein
MATSSLTTPVVLFAFNRPNTTTQVFAAIREARPSRLFLIADGPRSKHPDDLYLCSEVRRALDTVDWPCEVKYHFSDNNLGCRNRVSTGLDWVFHQVEEAIILEDDCLPDQTFFNFCQELLNKYRDEERVMSVCGSNPLVIWKADMQDYHFSLNGGIWGWATWRRAWQNYDVSMSQWGTPDACQKIKEVLGSGFLYRQRVLDFDRVAAGLVDTWDYQWSFAQLIRAGLTIIPSKNLVSNIGFNVEATHTVDFNNIFSALPVHQCNFPLKNNSQDLISDKEYDMALTRKMLSSRPIMQKIGDLIHYFTGRRFVGLGFRHG